MHRSLIIDKMTWVGEVFNQQRENYYLWLPVFFASGIALYFSIGFEPPLFLVAIILAIWLAVYILLRPIKFNSVSGGVMVSISFVLLLSLSGFLTAKIRTELISTPVIAKKLGLVMVVGDIIAIDKMEQGDGSRLTLSNLEIERLLPEDTPRKVRLRARADDGGAIGQRISALALLNPPSPPLLPDAFDFRRYLYFQSIGAVGFIYKAPEILSDASVRRVNIEGVRQLIANKITDQLTPEQAGVALALIVGQKHALSDKDSQAVRDAGLAHMLAISGLHVGLVSGALFFLLRLFLACLPNVALRYPIKKIAAIFALMGAAFYMLLAGSTVPTQRAVLMIAIVFLAIIIDRSPISLRLVAFAAFVILIIAPESLVSASFHMSFAAVTCLIYFYDVTRKFWIRFNAKAGWHRKILLYFISVCMTTVIASIATAPFSLYHFGQVSYMGSMANFVAVPLLAFIVMPFALISLIAMPLGLDYWPLQVVGFGIDYILDISYWAADLPGAVIRIGAWGHGSFLIFTMAALFMVLWKGWGKVLAVPFMFWAVSIAQSQVQPNILIAASHKLFAFKAVDSPLLVSSRRREKFVLKNWEEYYGLEKKSADILPYKGGKNGAGFYTCGENGCRMNIAGNKVSFIRKAYIQNQECVWADIIISVDPMPNNYNRKNRCKTEIIIDKFDTWKNGAYALWLGKDSVKVRNVAEGNSNRPWSAY